MLDFTDDLQRTSWKLQILCVIYRKRKQNSNLMETVCKLLKSWKKNWSLPYYYTTWLVINLRDNVCLSDSVFVAGLSQCINKIFPTFYYESKTTFWWTEELHYYWNRIIHCCVPLKKIRPYIMGAKITINKDHATLKYIFETKFVKPRFIRWAARIQFGDKRQDKFKKCGSWPPIQARKRRNRGRMHTNSRKFSRWTYVSGKGLKHTLVCWLCQFSYSWITPTWHKKKLLLDANHYY